jgi:hypothetical protein
VPWPARRLGSRHTPCAAARRPSSRHTPCAVAPRMGPGRTAQGNALCGKKNETNRTPQGYGRCKVVLSLRERKRFRGTPLPPLMRWTRLPPTTRPPAIVSLGRTPSGCKMRGVIHTRSQGGAFAAVAACAGPGLPCHCPFRANVIPDATPSAGPLQPATSPFLTPFNKWTNYWPPLPATAAPKLTTTNHLLRPAPLRNFGPGQQLSIS